MKNPDKSPECSPQKIRLVVEADDAEFLQKVAQVTGCGSPSRALSIFISRCGNLFFQSWQLPTRQQPAQSMTVPKPSINVPPAPKTNEEIIEEIARRIR